MGVLFHLFFTQNMGVLFHFVPFSPDPKTWVSFFTISPADVIALLNKAITQAAVAAHAQGLKQATVNLDEVGCE